MPHRLAWLAVAGALALAGCASNQEVAAKHCSDVAGKPGYDQCVQQELARLSTAQQPPASTGGGGY